MNDPGDKCFATDEAIRVPELPAQFYVLDNLNCFRMFAIDLLLIAFAIFIGSWWFAYPLAIALIGARQRAIADLLHQSSHRALARNRLLNRVLGIVAGYLVLQTWQSYWKSHVANHHGKFGTSDDPDYEFYRNRGFYGRLTLRGVVVGFRAYARYLFVSRLMPAKGGSSSYAEYVGLIVFWAVLVCVFGLTNILWYWLVPMAFGFGPIGYVVELAEHWPLMDAKSPLYQTRNRSSSWVEAWLFSTHHENYHLLHHLYPRLPNPAFRSADRHLRVIWPEYAEWASRNGGVVFSSNGAPSLAQLLITTIRSYRAPDQKRETDT